LFIEKNNEEKNDFNKFKLVNAELTKGAVEKFINDYYAKKLKFYFVSQAQLDVTEETLKDALTLLNGTATDLEMNKKYYNAGRNIYQIEGRHFESFMRHTLNKTVVMMACSFPMIHCKNGLEKLRFVTQTFNKFLDKVIFVETDPNFNEYVISKNKKTDNQNNDKNIDYNNSIAESYIYEDFYRYIFKPLYPQLVIFSAISQIEIEQDPNNLNSLIIKKLQNKVDFDDDFDCLNLIRLVGKNAEISPNEIEIDEKYLIEEDVNGNIKFTTDYDEDFLSEEELDKDKDLEARIEDLKEMLGPDAAELFDILQQQDPKKVKEIKQEMVKAVEDMEKNKNTDLDEKINEISKEENTPIEKDDL
jgi:hypothetical protein